ncbi:CYTH domain-containing protein [Arenibacter palladensis]|uniref:CYTH domain-containing protein n=1 Tax=Arenibacter palladensis TaxID=237373 RepID=A0A1M4URV5_9FLAO|nr:CYTH domain-containing protein [Arenibacter palladensis]SHE59398.1 CYTH domain-containing protein [Arenibacter palladensis]
MIEIERKFLVKSEAFKTDAVQKERIVQGFLNTDPLRTVRVRIKGDRGYITVKGKGNQNGTTRFEWEKEISVKEADALMNLSEPGVIDKMRYFIEVGKHIFEVDEFFGDNSGLIIAEVELEHEDEDFLKPQWLGDEVTSDIKYYNSQLSKNPFKTWKK